MIRITIDAFVLLGKKQRTHIFLLIALLLFSSVVELLGVISFLPFVDGILNIDDSKIPQQIQFIADQFGVVTPTERVVFLGLFSMVMLCFMHFMIGITTWYSLKFNKKMLVVLSDRLFRHYIKQDYSYFLGRNSADIGKNMLSELRLFFTGIFMQILMVISKLLPIMMITGFLLYQMPVMGLSALLMVGGAYVFVYMVLRTRMNRYGETRLNANRERYTTVMEVFGGIKEFKVAGLEERSSKRFSRSNDIYEHVNMRSVMLASLPRSIIEPLALVLLISFMLYFITSGGTFEALVSKLALVAMASYRILPGLQQVYNGVSQIRYNAHTLDNIKKQFEDCTEEMPDVPVVNRRDRMPMQEKVEVKELYFHYPSNKKDVLKGINMELPHRSCVGIVGKSGSGKTTLMDIMLGLYQPTRGSIHIDGVTLNDNNLRKWQNNIGYVPQSMYLSYNTLAYNIAWSGKDKFDKDMLERAAKMANIHDFIVNELPLGYDTEVGERGLRLSGGQRQRVAIARALYNDPEILIFDEATSALDNETENAIVESISGILRQKTIIMVAHRLTTLRYCDFIYELDQGVIAQRMTYQELMKNNEHQEAL